MEESINDYLSRLKERRDLDGYKYTNEDFETYKDYINNCCKTGLSVYKCLEFMWFATEEAENNFKDLKII
jgi:hypothetical protein